MRGILYFSSTGNSLQIAQQLRQILGGQIRYIPTFQGDGQEYDEIVIVSPVYSFGLPVHVYDLIPRLSKNRPVWIVLNYGGMAGGADGLAYRRCLEHGMDIRGVFLVKMPENYTLTFTPPDAYTKSLLRSAPKRVAKIARSIAEGEPRIPRKGISLERIYLKNRPTWHKVVEDLSVAEDCTQCGVCVSLCPADNIAIVDGKVTFSDRCVLCLGCYHRCPRKAIRYKNKDSKYRYLNPEIRGSDIGQDM